MGNYEGNITMAVEYKEQNWFTGVSVEEDEQACSN